MRVLNNKGFTLVEVLAVLVILVAIAAIAIPTITSSMERTKEKQNDAKKEMLASYAEEYVEDNKNEIYNNLGTSNECYIELDELTEKGYIKNGTELDVDGIFFEGKIKFNSKDLSYKYIEKEEIGSLTKCIGNSKQTYRELIEKGFYRQGKIYTEYDYNATNQKKYNLEGNCADYDITGDITSINGQISRNGYKYVCLGNTFVSSCEKIIEIIKIENNAAGDNVIEYRIHS